MYIVGMHKSRNGYLSDHGLREWNLLMLILVSTTEDTISPQDQLLRTYSTIYQKHNIRKTWSYCGITKPQVMPKSLESRKNHRRDAQVNQDSESDHDRLLTPHHTASSSPQQHPYLYRTRSLRSSNQGPYPAHPEPGTASVS